MAAGRVIVYRKLFSHVSQFSQANFGEDHLLPSPYLLSIYDLMSFDAA